MTDADSSLTLSNTAGTIDLYSWLTARDPDVSGFEALSGILGFGMPDQSNRWFEGAGHGATLRGFRVLPRNIDLPLEIRGKNRTELNENLDLLALILNPRKSLPTLSFGLPGGDVWQCNVVREGGGDWARGTRGSSDNSTFVRPVLSLRAGDPFWTRERPEHFDVVQDASGRGLLPYMARMELSSVTAFGKMEVYNEGSAESSPTFRATGPFTSLTFIGDQGETLVWNGNILAGNGLLFERGKVTDFNGVNRYDGLAPSPKFWKIEPGYSEVEVNATGVTSASRITVEYKPRKWMVA